MPFNTIVSQSFFYPISRRYAEDLLQDEPHGSFIFRPQSLIKFSPNKLVLSYVADDEILHYNLFIEHDGITIEIGTNEYKHDNWDYFCDFITFILGATDPIFSD